MQLQSSERFTSPHYFAKHPRLEYPFILSLLLGQIFTQASSNAVLPLLNVLGKAFDSDSATSTWYMSSFSLACTLILVSGRIGDMYGLRATVLCGYSWTLLWSILAGVSSYVRTANFFIVCRAMQGAGLAFVLPNLIGVAGRVYRPGTHRKNMVFAGIGLSAPLGGGLGPIIDGLIATETVHWEWAFYHYAIAIALGLVLAWFSVPYITPHRKEDAEAPVDWIGCLLGVAALVLINFVWNQAPAAGWGSAYIIVLLIVSLILLGVFCWYESHIPKNPLIPRQVMQDPRMILTLLTLLLSWGSFGILLYRFFVFVLELRNYNPLQAGATQVPILVSGPLAALTAGYLMSYIRAQYLLVVSMINFMSIDLMCLLLPVHQTYYRVSMGVWILGVWGMDWSFPAGSIILSDALPPQFQGMAGSLLTTMINYGISLFLGIAGTVEAQVLKRDPGNILAAHKACMYFALGLSSGSIAFAVIVAILTLRRGPGTTRTNDPGGSNVCGPDGCVSPDTHCPQLGLEKVIDAPPLVHDVEICVSQTVSAPV